MASPGFMQGYLNKQPGYSLFRQWQKRWCIVRDGRFHYFREQRESVPAGTIEMNTVVEVSRGADRHIKIITRDREYLFQACSDQDLAAWILALENSRRDGAAATGVPAGVPAVAPADEEARRLSEARIYPTLNAMEPSGQAGDERAAAVKPVQPAKPVHSRLRYPALAGVVLPCKNSTVESIPQLAVSLPEEKLRPLRFNLDFSVEKDILKAQEPKEPKLSPRKIPADDIDPETNWEAQVTASELLLSRPGSRSVAAEPDLVSRPETTSSGAVGVPIDQVPRNSLQTDQEIARVLADMSLKDRQAAIAREVQDAELARKLARELQDAEYARKLAAEAAAQERDAEFARKMAAEEVHGDSFARTKSQATVMSQLIARGYVKEQVEWAQQFIDSADKIAEFIDECAALQAQGVDYDVRHDVIRRYV